MDSQLEFTPAVAPLVIPPPLCLSYHIIITVQEGLGVHMHAQTVVNE